MCRVYFKESVANTAMVNPAPGIYVAVSIVVSHRYITNARILSIV